MSVQRVFDFLAAQRVVVRNADRAWPLSLSSVEFASYDDAFQKQNRVLVTVAGEAMELSDPVTGRVVGVSTTATPLGIDLGSDIAVDAVFVSAEPFESVDAVNSILPAELYVGVGRREVRVHFEKRPDPLLAPFEADERSIAVRRLTRDRVLRAALESLPAQRGLYLVAFLYEPEYRVFVDTVAYTSDVQALLDAALTGYSKRAVSASHVVYSAENQLPLHVEFGASLGDYLFTLPLDIDMCYWDISTTHYFVPVSVVPAYAVHLMDPAFVSQQSLLRAADRIASYADTGFHITISKCDQLLIWRTLFRDRALRPVIEWNGIVATADVDLPQYILTTDNLETPTLATTLVFPSYAVTNTIWRARWEPRMLRDAMQLLRVGEYSDAKQTADGVALARIPHGAPDAFASERKVGGETCTDVIGGDEEEVKSFLEASPDNLVFVFPTEHAAHLACYSRTYLSHAPEFYECMRPNSRLLGVSVQYDAPIFRLDVREFPIYVTLENMDFLRTTGAQMFVVEPTPTRFSHTVSRANLESGNGVSADHCQDGTDKQLSAVRAMA